MCNSNSVEAFLGDDFICILDKRPDKMCSISQQSVTRRWDQYYRQIILQSQQLTDRIYTYYILNSGIKSVTFIKSTVSSQHNPKAEHDLFVKSNHDHHPPGRCAGSCAQQRRIRATRSPRGLWQMTSQSTLVRAFALCSKLL